ncbi:MAG: radical SAM protein [Myxococcota bacterium]
MADTLRAPLLERRARERGSRFQPGSRRVAMAYPSPYRAAMSSLGYQWVLEQLASAGLSVERVVLPDEVAEYRRRRAPVVSLETLTPLGQFPVIAVSLAYELELAGLVELLELSGIPPRREDRTAGHPVVVIGGPLTFSNPLPAAPFADVMLLGEAEETAPIAVSGYFEHETRESWLNAVAALPGAFLPERDGVVLPAVAKASDALLPARSHILSPDAELADMFLIEGERGCHRGCAFCVMRRSTNGGMRLVTPERILSYVPEEARKVGLVGAAISDHPQLVELLEVLVGSGRQVSLSSLRADRIERRPAIARLLRESGARTLTVASDGASRRLRREIQKGTVERHLEACAQITGELGFDVYKVYMMVGLPGENEDDIQELVDFTLKLRALTGRTRVALGIAPFVAKRNTPLDGQPFAGVKEVERTLKALAKGLRGKVEVRPTSARWAWVEYELAQGGPEAGEAVLEAVHAGATFADYKRALLALDPDTKRPWAPLAAK